ncbi:MAG: hypothetical protein A3C84_05185 [Candidatus Ryanbacteria bacterium RIFCSPHIGHO2_02_FULL_48_12]|uniref:Uncharacterized protein n=1 Tax=Candidatus Ryanbacteria bacterium RIFCSPHIGHO2_01_FULL_48_27 TaxID=1802115 RepID=A0A1G2G7A0_9BACT|nr:MAG: hypothetical protein A2756_05940 [Candidatus Ryanbacteria bacterium RIFCSPHIGHO2_01_FULL_48_27]OGZ49555.1 MAG: hypothetical protein A3C84_05185 [Candidatus Ryanbacteria bacterium RIFCSPHIGHO2_02_FULL_48_12]
MFGHDIDTGILMALMAAGVTGAFLASIYVTGKIATRHLDKNIHTPKPKWRRLVEMRRRVEAGRESIKLGILDTVVMPMQKLLGRALTALTSIDWTMPGLTSFVLCMPFLLFWGMGISLPMTAGFAVPGACLGLLATPFVFWKYKKPEKLIVRIVVTPLLTIGGGAWLSCALVAFFISITYG